MKKFFNKKLFIILIIVLLIILTDQLFKVLIINNLYESGIILVKGILKLTYVENTGGAFGIGKNDSLILTLINIIIIGTLISLAYLKRKKINKIKLGAILLIIAGGISNLIDRIFRGYVIDYIDINPLFKYPVFNFADICIVLGVIIIIIDLVFQIIGESK